MEVVLAPIGKVEVVVVVVVSISWACEQPMTRMTVKSNNTPITNKKEFLMFILFILPHLMR